MHAHTPYRISLRASRHLKSKVLVCALSRQQLLPVDNNPARAVAKSAADARAKFTMEYEMQITRRSTRAQAK